MLCKGRSGVVDAAHSWIAIGSFHYSHAALRAGMRHLCPMIHWMPTTLAREALLVLYFIEEELRHRGHTGSGTAGSPAQLDPESMVFTMTYNCLSITIIVT